MKKKLYLLLNISMLFFLIACKNNETENNESKESNEGTENIDNNVHAKDNQKNNQEEQTKFIDDAFQTLFNYDNSDYRERSEKVTEYFTGEALQVLTENEHLDTDVSFESTSDNYKVYQEVGNDTNNFILTAETSFQLEDNPPTELESVYEFELLEQDGEYKINDLKSTPKQQQSKMP